MIRFFIQNQLSYITKKNTVYPLTDFPVKESDVTNNFYESYHIVAWMKRFTEIVCEMYSNRIKEPMKTIVVRPGNLYGPYDKFDWEKSKVIPAIMRRAIERHDPFEVWGDGMDLKDFLYIDDYIDGMLLAMEKLDDFQPINIANGQAVTIRDVLKEILIIKKNGSKKILKNKDLDFKYRKSNLSDHDIVTSAVFKANFGEKEEIELKMSEIKFFRKNSQPIETKTGGSTFKNPKKQFAAKLIDNSDCKGLIYGDAIVSNKHSNFLVNLGNATAKDIETLGKIVQDRVLKKFNISLEWEIKIIGESSE